MVDGGAAKTGLQTTVSSDIRMVVNRILMDMPSGDAGIFALSMMTLYR